MSKLFFLIVILIGFNGWSQTFKFHQYSSKNGLSQDFVYTINQSNKGYLWVGTGEGLNQFDGKKITPFYQKDGLSENIIVSSHKSKKGELWFGHNNGTITKLVNNSFEKVNTDKNIQSSINGIESINDKVYFISQNEGLFIYKNKTTIPLGKFNQDLFYTFKIVDKKTILLSGNNGLQLLKQSENEWQIKQTLSEIEVTSIIITHNNKIIIGSNSGELLFLNILENDLEITPVVKNLNIAFPIKQIIEDKAQDLWLATAGAGVVKISNYLTHQPDFDYYNENNGLPTNYIQSIFQDREDNIWIGSFGSGLFALTERYFLFYNQLKNNDVTSIQVYNNIKWFGTKNGLLEVLPNDSSILYNSKNKFIDDEITALQLFDSVLWIGTQTNGLYQYSLPNKKFTKIEWKFGNTQNKINDIYVEKNRIWIATNGGLIIYDKNAKSTTVLTTEDGIDHNAIESIYKTTDGRLFLGTYSRNLFVIENSSIQEIELIESGELKIIDFTETSNGNLWLSTAENGVFKLSHDSIFSFTTLNGLLSNYCYAIEADANDKIWVGHRNGLSNIDPENHNKISIYNSNDGVGSQVNKRAMFLDQKNYLWIGTEEGVIRFDSKKDIQNKIYPIINLTDIIINDKSYQIQNTLQLPYGTYRVNFNFIGISLQDPEHIFYQYMLEGYDESFSKPSKETSATYSKLQDGEYVFRVKAYLNSNQTLNDETFVRIIIAKPFWKKWWFFLLVLFGLIGIIYSFFWFKIQRLKKQKATIQKELDIKTEEVVKSAKKIEIINKDLMSSINYALKLQKSILPPKRHLSQVFPNSFIYFKPRNVVSGDFYFINQCGSKQIFACVDCTGHGVPGAFMSLIGFVALRDIYRINEAQDKWQTPDQILESLDKEVKILLETHSVDDNTNNGMDMILCEFDMETNELLVASAKRPIVIYNEGKLKIIKGEKRSIGEQDFGLIMPYQLHRFSIKPNDCIYMFSDGFTDQFGGENNKKFGIRQTVTILNNAVSLNKKEQQTYIIESFESWMKNKPQTDDIIFMGVYF